MGIAVLLALAVVAAFIWLGRRSRKGRGDWRVAAGLIGILSLAGAAVATARGEWVVGLVLLLAAGWFGVDVRRRGTRPAPKPQVETMTEAKARAIMGVGAKADPAEIQAAYLRRMREVHPDAGGTPEQAAELNAARDRLQKRS